MITARQKQLINESKLYAKERNALSDSQFGIPETRSFPLNDESHIKAAIRMFNKCEPQYRTSLAKRILLKMKAYNISTDMIGENNMLRKFIK